MSRPVRIVTAGGWYHVMSRGIERRRIFAGAVGEEKFLETIGEMSERYRVEVHAYALMVNHYHLLVRLTEENLSRAFQWLNLTHGARFNAARRRSGHLFQGRFKAVLIGEEALLSEMTRYIHLNPVRISALGLDKTGRSREEAGGQLPTGSTEMLKARLERLRTYPWTSYRAFAGYAKAPEWLNLKLRDAYCGRSGFKVYREFVEEGARLGSKVEDPLRGRLAEAYAGSREMLETLQERIRADRRQQSRSRELQSRVAFETIVKAVEEAKGECWLQFRDRRGDWGRDVVLSLARRRSGMTLSELARRCDVGTDAAISAALNRIQRQRREDRSLDRIVSRIEKTLKC